MRWIVEPEVYVGLNLRKAFREDNFLRLRHFLAFKIKQAGFLILIMNGHSLGTNLKYGRHI